MARRQHGCLWPRSTDGDLLGLAVHSGQHILYMEPDHRPGHHTAMSDRKYEERSIRARSIRVLTCTYSWGPRELDAMGRELRLTTRLRQHLLQQQCHTSAFRAESCGRTRRHRCRQRRRLLESRVLHRSNTKREHNIFVPKLDELD